MYIYVHTVNIYIYDVRSHFASSLSILGEWLNQKQDPDYVKEKAREIFSSHQAMLATLKSRIRGCLCITRRPQSARTEYTPDSPIENRSCERIQQDEEISALWARVLETAYSERTAHLHATSLCAGLSGRRVQSFLDIGGSLYLVELLPLSATCISLADVRIHAFAWKFISGSIRHYAVWPSVRSQLRWRYTGPQAARAPISSSSEESVTSSSSSEESVTIPLSGGVPLWAGG